MKTEICKIVHNINSFILRKASLEYIDYIEFIVDHVEDIRSVQSLSIPEEIQTIYNLHDERFNVQSEENKKERTNRILIESESFDLVTLEFPIDTSPEILSLIPSERRIISWSPEYLNIEQIEKTVKDILSIPAAQYKINPKVDDVSDALVLLNLRSKIDHDGLTLYASGQSGLWSQILSINFGNPIIYCEQEGNTQDLFTLDKLVFDYGLPTYTFPRKVYGIVGNPVYHSLSPRIHNQCHRYYKDEAIYLPFHVEHFEEFTRFIDHKSLLENLGIELSGFTMISPFKESTFQWASENRNPFSNTSQASNIMIKEGDSWVSDSSDGYAISQILENAGYDFRKLKVAIFGCGGAGRTIAATLLDKQASIHLYNRSLERGVFAADILGIHYDGLDCFEVNGYNIIINATPSGKKGEEPFFDPAHLEKDTVVIDLAYAKEETPLIKRSRLLGLPTYNGKEILNYQVRKQYNVLTKRVMPAHLIEHIIYNSSETIKNK